MFPQTLRMLRSKTALAACLVIVIAASVTAIFAWPDPISARPAPLVLGGPGPAAEWIDATIARLRTQPQPPPDPARPVTHVHVQQWAMDTTDVTVPVEIHDVHRFWAPDHSAHVRDVKLSDKQAAAARTRTPADGYEVYPPGEYALVFGTGELSADPAVLSEQLARNEPLENGTYVLPRAAAAAAELYCWGPAQRIAVLMVLREISDVVSRGTVIDRAGRRGTALTIDSGDPHHWNQPTPRARDVLVFADDGQLLAHELVAIDAPRALPHLPVPAVTAYTLILSTQKVMALTPPAAT